MDIKKLTTLLATLLCAAGLFAQTYTGGVRGTVISRADRTPVTDAVLEVYQGSTLVATASVGEDGRFLVEDLLTGAYDLVIYAPDYLESRVNVTVDDGVVKNLFNLSLVRGSVVSDVDVDNLVEFDMDDTGYSDSPVVLFGQNDVFNNMAGYNFSSVRYRTRGYASESQDVYLAGVKMNDAITGYSPFSLWSGLNEATRTKYTVNGSELSDYGIGGYNGLTNIPVNALSVRKGWRGSVLTNSQLYRLRLMMTYASGPQDNGWSYAFNVSARLGGNDWVQGVYYRSFAYYAAVEKQFDDVHKLGAVLMGTPGERGAANASTQEVYDLMGDNMYNSNWGYQNGKVRNARVRKTHEPIAILKYDFTPSQAFNAAATVLYRFGRNGYTALDWYDAQDPRPDYYRNLPSYFYMEDADYGRLNPMKAAWAAEAWTRDIDNYAHVNWDRLYAVNKLNIEDGERRSKYAQQERRVDQQDLNFALSFKWRPARSLTFNGGFDAKVNRTEYYQLMADLLGGDYFYNMDSFAERDYAAFPYMTQNDLAYWMENGHAQKIRVGDKYGYDYYANVRKWNGWLSGKLNVGPFELGLGGRIGQTAFWRHGLNRKGLFPGVNDDGTPFVIDGMEVTTYDDNGDPITSYGKSKVARFLTYAGKANLNFILPGGHRFYANVGYFNDAPNFNQAFMSPRTRNTLAPDLTTVKTVTGDINYQVSSNGYNFRITGYYTDIMDQSKVMSFYDDSQNSFTNFALTGIDERHAGMEMGFKIPTDFPNLALQGVLGYGEYYYTSNPKMYQTIDNNASIVEDTYGVVIPYWKSHPNADGSITRHYVESTPQLAASLGLAWNWNYWFVDADIDYFAHSYLSMNPLYRTDYATAGPDREVTPEEVEYMASQEKLDPAWLLNLSVGKSWYIQRKYQLGFSLNAKNLLNNRWVKTGGYEQNRIVENTVAKERFYRFDSRYFYMSGFNYMLNIYFRF
ncbi:MAG: TonB-dependent receptor [Bacteroidales bacterium]|nr:TonB-dependent receptor [Bacteroidales bacterium]